MVQMDFDYEHNEIVFRVSAAGGETIKRVTEIEDLLTLAIQQSDVAVPLDRIRRRVTRVLDKAEREEARLLLGGA
jgi:hypothetical protein